MGGMVPRRDSVTPGQRGPAHGRRGHGEGRDVGQAQVVGGVDPDDTGHLGRLPGLDRSDPGVGHRRPDEHGVEGARQV